MLQTPRATHSTATSHPYAGASHLDRFSRCWAAKLSARTLSGRSKAPYDRLHPETGYWHLGVYSSQGQRSLGWKVLHLPSWANSSSDSNGLKFSASVDLVFVVRLMVVRYKEIPQDHPSTSVLFCCLSNQVRGFNNCR